MRVVITGASGFVGSWATLAFLNEGFEVHAVSRGVNRFDSIAHEQLHLHTSSSSEWAKLIKVISPDFVIHCDWAGVQNSEKDSDSQSENVFRWHAMAQTEINVGVKKSIFIGSQAEYGGILGVIPEDSTPSSPITKYGVAKVNARQKLEMLYATSTSQFLWARLFSTYGALDDGSWLVPSCFQALLRGDSFRLSSGKQRWNYIHGADVGRALVASVKADELEGIVNISAVESVSIHDLVSQIGEFVGNKSVLSFNKNPVQEIPDVLPINIKLANIGWGPTIDLSRGLELTMNWIKGDSQPLKDYGFENLNFNLFSRSSSGYLH